MARRHNHRPFRVLRRGEKQFDIGVLGLHSVVLIDRLKSVHIEDSDTASPAPSSVTPPSEVLLLQTLCHKDTQWTSLLDAPSSGFVNLNRLMNVR
ncbi:hypothetical protein HPB50_027931 [Hyalomma asiaticum]|nr:hypothetical protein HPB50_027931 [Hyalomma asiaticum]